jgi:hypothetical protein
LPAASYVEYELMPDLGSDFAITNAAINSDPPVFRGIVIRVVEGLGVLLEQLRLLAEPELRGG